MEQLKFKGKFFKGTENAVHVEDSYVQKMIDEVYERLIESKEDWDFSFSITGDTLVFGWKCVGDDEITVIVTQDYDEALSFTEDGGKTWEPLDWTAPLEDEELTKEELMLEILKLKRKIDDMEAMNKCHWPDYNPRHEV